MFVKVKDLYGLTVYVNTDYIVCMNTVNCNRPVRNKDNSIILEDYIKTKVITTSTIIELDENSYYILLKAIDDCYDGNEKLTIWQKIKIFFSSWLEKIHLMNSSSKA